MIVYGPHNGARIVTTLQTVKESRLLTPALSPGSYRDINAIFFHECSSIRNIHLGSRWGLKWCKHLPYQISHSTNCRWEDSIIMGRKQIGWEGGLD